MVSSINHDPCWHELHSLSNTFIVLAFSELTSFVRKILQREENKGVELTVWREMKLETRSQKLECRNEESGKEVNSLDRSEK